MKQKGFNPIIIILVLVVIGLIVYFGISYKSTTQPISTTIPNVSATPDPKENWMTYTSQKYKFEFKYPPESKLNDQSDQYVAVSYMGEKQKASGRTQTELFDGYAFNVADMSDSSYKNLDDLYDAKLVQLKDVCTNIGEPKETKIDGIRAITHKSSCLGDFDTYYVQNGDVFFEIGLLYSGDSDDLPRYTNTVNQILSTFKFKQ